MILAWCRWFPRFQIAADVSVALYRYRVYNPGNVRFLVGLGLSLALAAGAPQTSEELRAHYGAPDMERFPIGLPINAMSLTVEYGSDRSACRMILERSPLVRGELADPVITLDIIKAILEEAVPLRDRGTLLPMVVAPYDGVQKETEMYEKVTITLLENPGKDFSIRSAVVVFRRPACRDFSANNLPHY